MQRYFSCTCECTDVQVDWNFIGSNIHTGFVLLSIHCIFELSSSVTSISLSYYFTDMVVIFSDGHAWSGTASTVDILDNVCFNLIPSLQTTKRNNTHKKIWVCKCIDALRKVFDFIRKARCAILSSCIKDQVPVAWLQKLKLVCGVKGDPWILYIAYDILNWLWLDVYCNYNMSDKIFISLPGQMLSMTVYRTLHWHIETLSFW